MSPPRQEQSYDDEIACIPLERSIRPVANPFVSNDQNSSFVDAIIRAFNPEKHQIQLADATRKLTMPDSLQQKLQSIMQRYAKAKEFTTTEVDVCLSQLLQATQRPKYLAHAILACVQRTSDEKLCTKSTPPAPPMRPIDQKCLVLVLRLAKLIPRFDQYLRMEIERETFRSPKPLPLPAAINQMYLYIALLDIDTDQSARQTSSNIRLLIYKCMYYYPMEWTPLVLAILTAYPMAIPHAANTHTHPDPLIRVLATILSTESYGADADPLQRKQDMFYFLKIRYGYFAIISFPWDETIQYCIDCLKQNQLKNVGYALLLLARRRGWEWAMKAIVETHLMPMLQQFMANAQTSAVHDQQIATIVFMKASILAMMPTEYVVDEYLDMFAAILVATERKVLQEAAVSALCRMARFGCANVYTRIADWKPDYEVDHAIKAMLLTFVHRKTRGFWFDA